MSIVAVIDTNVWVSAFLNPDGYPARIIEAAKNQAFLIVSAPPLLDELLSTFAASTRIFAKSDKSFASIRAISGLFPDYETNDYPTNDHPTNDYPTTNQRTPP